MCCKRKLQCFFSSLLSFSSPPNQQRGGAAVCHHMIVRIKCACCARVPSRCHHAGPGRCSSSLVGIFQPRGLKTQRRQRGKKPERNSDNFSFVCAKKNKTQKLGCRRRTRGGGGGACDEEELAFPPSSSVTHAASGRRDFSSRGHDESSEFHAAAK